ncbi:MAG: myo-inositol 2-dehydrogenase / D-chiro-inositol 1-dehydrogenase [Chloroflexota bacterium]|nr:myo-inositol 2-dehydrogenase / D-chiro-inositol 1-dehydrogenase [Chloroflexota bacterium]
MRIALIGAGRIGRLHGQVLSSLPGVDQVLVADANAEAARSLAADIGGLAVDRDIDAIKGSDAVVIAATTNAHAELVRQSVGLDRPTFVEKPLALDLDESRQLVDFVHRSGVAVQVGFQRRFDTAFVEARRLVGSGDLGTLYAVRLIAHDASPPPESYISTSGGIFRDSSIHDFDALRFVTGVEVDDVFAVGAVRGFPTFAEYGDVDTVAAILRLADGTIATLSQTRHNPRGYDVRMELVGSRDAVSIGLGPRTPTRSLQPDGPDFGAGWDSFLTRFESAYRAELAAFVRVARGEAPSPCSADDGYQAMRVAVAASRSLATGQPVKVTDVV